MTSAARPGNSTKGAVPQTGTVYFAHGKESGPWGGKIRALARVAESHGYRVESPDYSGLDDPDARVEKLLALAPSDPKRLVLVGSSMGGYVSTVASASLMPQGLFLMAPAFYRPGYANQNPVPHSPVTVVVHGWQDTVIEPEASVCFGRTYKVELHLINDDHRLQTQIPFLEKIFGCFLERVRDRVPGNQQPD